MSGFEPRVLPQPKKGVLQTLLSPSIIYSVVKRLTKLTKSRRNNSTWKKNSKEDDAFFVVVEAIAPLPLLSANTTTVDTSLPSLVVFLLSGRLRAGQRLCIEN
jgi:hypothetical protein